MFLLAITGLKFSILRLIRTHHKPTKSTTKTTALNAVTSSDGRKTGAGTFKMLYTSVYVFIGGGCTCAFYSLSLGSRPYRSPDSGDFPKQKLLDSCVNDDEWQRKRMTRRRTQRRDCVSVCDMTRFISSEQITTEQTRGQRWDAQCQLLPVRGTRSITRLRHSTVLRAGRCRNNSMALVHERTITDRETVACQ
jgi:hypothetical protein